MAALEQASGRQETLAALLVAIAATRLRRLGLPVAEHSFHEPELRLYRTLCRDHPASAYQRQNALLRRLVRFARALEREHGQTIRAAGSG